MNNAVSSSVQSLTSLKNLGYYFGNTIYFRLRFKQLSYWTESAYFTGSVANIMKSIPDGVTGLSITQTLTSIVVVWSGLSTSWSSSDSPNGIGNDPVTFQL